MPNKDFYTASEAQQVLGLSKAEFHRRASQGRIPRFLRTGYKQAVYPKADIDALARSMHNLFESYEQITFSKSTIAEQEEEMKIGLRCFGAEFITPLPVRIAFQQKSEFSYWSLKVEGRGVVGYVSLLRFSPSFLEDLFTGRQIEREITVQQILPFERLQSFDVYIDVMAVDPTLPIHHRRYYAGLIAVRLARKLLDLRSNGYLIQRLCTVATRPEGDKMLKKLGFSQVQGKSIVPGRVPYEFLLDEAGVQKIQEFIRRGSSLPYL